MKSEELHAAVERILADADADIVARRPVCRTSGRCCRFESYNHRMYVTAAELSYFARALKTNEPTQIENQESNSQGPGLVSLPQFFAQPLPEGCPYQVDNLCTARDARPLGCRVYFCDENAQSWQNELYEKYHGRLRALHEQFGIPYRYMEWRAALREISGG